MQGIHGRGFEDAQDDTKIDLFTDTITNAFFGEAVVVALDRFRFWAKENSALLGALFQRTDLELKSSKPFIRIGIGHVIVVVGIEWIHVGLFIFPAFVTHHALRLAFFINENHGMALAALGALLAHDLSSTFATTLHNSAIRSPSSPSSNRTRIRLLFGV
jgi:hypothetical protein